MPIKKLFKSVSKVANKVADKIVPKEIAPLLPVAAAFAPMFLPGIGAAVGGGLGSFLSSTAGRYAVPQLLTALGSAKTTGEINPIAQGLAALSSYAAGPKQLTPAETEYLKQVRPEEFIREGVSGVPDAISGTGEIDFAKALKSRGDIIPKDFDMSSLDLSFGDKIKTMVGEAGGGLQDLYQAGGLKGALTAGTIGGSAALTDQAINAIQNMQAEQEAAMLADQELREQYGQGVQDLASLYGSLINFPLAGINMAEGGIADVAPGMPKGMQVDGRNGTFIPMGVKEKADDVPAMLSKNEFVMTADAVRGMGGGDVNAGAQRMYDLMNSLEARV